MTSPIKSNSYASLEGIAADIRAHQRTTSHSVLAIGMLLQTAKDMVGHGEFSIWAQVKCSLSARSVQRYMQAARRLEGKYDTVSLLQPGTIYALTAKAVDDALLANILEQGCERPLQDEEVLSLLVGARTQIQADPRPSQGETNKLEHAWEAFFTEWKAAETDSKHQFCRQRAAEIKDWLTSAAGMGNEAPPRETTVRPVLTVLSAGQEHEAERPGEDADRTSPGLPAPTHATEDGEHPLDIPPCLRRTA